MTNRVDYWDQRAKQVSRLSAVKRWPPLQWLLSVRIGDEAAAPRYLRTEPGIGYRFLGEASPGTGRNS